MFWHFVIGALIWLWAANKVVGEINELERSLPIPVVILTAVFAPLVVVVVFVGLVLYGVSMLVWGLGRDLKKAINRRRDEVTA